MIKVTLAENRGTPCQRIGSSSSSSSSSSSAKVVRCSRHDESMREGFKLGKRTKNAKPLHPQQYK